MKFLLVLEFDNYKRTYFVSTGKYKLLMKQKIRHHKKFYELVFFSKYGLYWYLNTVYDNIFICTEFWLQYMIILIKYNYIFSINIK